MADLTVEQTAAIAAAHRLADMGVPIFSAYPDSSKPGDFLRPNAWQMTKPGEVSHRWIDRWKPGMALCAVTGVVFDVIDTDMQNGGLAGRMELDALGFTVYAVARTPSTGTHEFIGRTHLNKGVPAKGVDLQAGADDGTGRGYVYIAPTARPAKFGPDLGQVMPYVWELEPENAPPAQDESVAALVAHIQAVKGSRTRVKRTPATVAPADQDAEFEAATDVWTTKTADAEIEAQLASVRTAQPGVINGTLGGAARFLGRFVGGGYLTEDDAATDLLEAIGENPAHSDAWNMEHGLKWTAASVVMNGLANGQEEPWAVTPAGTVAEEGPAAMAYEPAVPPLRIENAAKMAYWLQAELGTARLSGFFLRAGQVVHTPRVGQLGYVPAPDGGDNGPAEIRPVTGETLAAKLQYLYRCFKVVKAKKEGDPDTESEAMFPVVAAKTAVAAPEAMLSMRTLKGVTLTPMMRRDGTVLDQAGYDPASGYLYLPAPGVDVKPVPDAPSREQIDAARDLLLRMVVDFPFATDEDRANYLGMLVTPLIREMAPPSYKMFGIGAHQPGSGKSLLAEIVGKIHGAVWRSETPEDEAEWRKQTTSILANTSAPAVVLDNVTGVLKSAVLAGLLTSSGEIQDRELGKSTNLAFRNDRVWVVTGNNLSLGGDLVRRTILVMINPDMANPEQRTEFVIPDLSAWVDDHRNDVLWSLLVLVRAWVAEGRPEPARKQSDSFARWERTVAGILKVAGIPGEFDQESGKRAAGGGDDEGLTTLLGKLWDRFQGRGWSVVDALTPTGTGEFVLERDWLPTPVLDKLTRSEGAARKTMGYWLANRVGRWVTDEDGTAMVLRKEPKKMHGVAIWRIERR